jgi:LPXTG-site transpeptidase (sortase) family protein
MPDWTLRRPVWAAAAALVLAAGLGAGLLAARLQPARPVAAAPVVRNAGPVAAVPTASPTPDALWKPLPVATSSFVPADLVIQKLRVQAPVEVKGVDAHNVMEAPDRAMDAAWYRFTARPGAGSNAVFAGHLDFGRLGNPAIFWHLDQLARGDLIEVVSPQQTEIRYRVTQTWDYTVRTMPMASVLATDRTDEVTLITCAGTYTNGLGYDHRFVVRAVRTT